MKEYEISYNNKKVGKVKLFKDNINKVIKNSLITSNNDIKYEILNQNTEMQQYEVLYTLNDIDELYDIISKYIYNNEEVFLEIDKIKEYNNIKTIKKNTTIKIIIPEIYLNNLSLSKNDIDVESLFKSKIYFIKNILNKNNINNLMYELDTIVNNYKTFKSSNEYDFFTNEEKEKITNNYLEKTNKIIEVLENNTKYKYGKDFIIPIKINKQ